MVEYPSSSSTAAGSVVCLMPLQTPEAPARQRDLSQAFGDHRLVIRFADSGLPAEGGPGAERRLRSSFDALLSCDDLAALPFGLIGLGPGSALVLLAAVAQRARLRAVVACGGPLHASHHALPLLRLPTLLIVGGADDAALVDSHRDALRLLPGLKRLETVPGARSCFSEPGCFETAVHHAADWFAHHLVRR